LYCLVTFIVMTLMQVIEGRTRIPGMLSLGAK
jgi:hypothetical protein